ncbi:MAG: GntR family transcriptional regulator [Clostridiaceae bacterium]|nr:GntR family transcriptional regulator [Clostridiaceae bacterium]
MGEKPLYQVIKDSLSDKINSRQLLPGQQLPTEFELARQFGVSRITSKRALEELEKEGYIRRKRGQGSFVSAQSAKTSSGPINKIISLILPHFHAESWAMAYIKGAMDYLNPRGFFLSIHGTGDVNERAILYQLVHEGVGGIIYYPDYTVSHIDVLTAISMNRIPLVTIDKYYDGLPISSVVSDNYQGEYMAVRHLVELGHSHIALICSSQIGERSSVRDRFLGYCYALRDSGLEIIQDYILDDYFRVMHQYKDQNESHEFLKSRLQSLLQSNVTAMLIENDYEGITIYRLLKEMGVRIPEDLSMIGFDNSEMLVHNGIYMTTINQHFHQIGSKAADLIVAQMDDPDAAPQHIVLPVELIPGKTTAEAPKASV